MIQCDITGPGQYPLPTLGPGQKQADGPTIFFSLGVESTLATDTATPVQVVPRDCCDLLQN